MMTVEIKVVANLKEKKFNMNSRLNQFGYRVKDSFLREYTSGTKTGIMYGKHRASAPNETPARITGKLGNSLLIRVSSNILNIVDTSGYGKFLEFGTKKIAKREGVLQAIEKNKGQFENDLSKHLK
jgi:hypothetical protein